MNCRVCNQPDVEGGNAHNQDPPTSNEACPQPGCTSKIMKWCPVNGAKMCWAGHRFDGAGRPIKAD